MYIARGGGSLGTCWGGQRGGERQVEDLVRGRGRITGRVRVRVRVGRGRSKTMWVRAKA